MSSYWDSMNCRMPSFTISLSLLKLMYIESMMPSNHLIICFPLLCLPLIFPSNLIYTYRRTWQIWDTVQSAVWGIIWVRGSPQTSTISIKLMLISLPVNITRRKQSVSNYLWGPNFGPQLHSLGFLIWGRSWDPLWSLHSVPLYHLISQLVLVS